MATINLGNVVGMLRSVSPPASKPYVLWGKITNVLTPDVVELHQYSGVGDPALESNWDLLSSGGSFWSAKGSGIEYIGPCINTRIQATSGDDAIISYVNEDSALSLGLEGAGVTALQDNTKGQEVSAQVTAGVLDNTLTAVMSVINATTKDYALLGVSDGVAIMQTGEDYVSPSDQQQIAIQKTGIVVAYTDVDGTSPYPLTIKSSKLSGGAFRATDDHDVVIGDGLGTCKLGFFGSGGANQNSMNTVLPLSAGATYTSTEQEMLQDVHDKLETLLSILDGHNLVKVN